MSQPKFGDDYSLNQLPDAMKLAKEQAKKDAELFGRPALIAPTLPRASGPNRAQRRAKKR